MDDLGELWQDAAFNPNSEASEADDAENKDLEDFLRDAGVDPNFVNEPSLVDDDMADRWHEKLPVQDLGAQMASESKKSEIIKN